jgi:imidazolonepropionase-like amidohydrolase
MIVRLLALGCIGIALAHGIVAPVVAEDAGWPRAAPTLPGEAAGPFARLIIEGGMLVDGTGAPPVGPVTIVVERDRIAQIYGLPGMYTAQLPDGGHVTPQAGDRVIDARGQFILPGLIDAHVRVLDLPVSATSGNTARSGNAPPDYVLKLLVAHGVTTIASSQSMDVMDWALDLRRESAAGHVTAPNVEVWVDFPASSPDEARAKVREAKKRGAAGLGEGDIEGNVATMLAGLDEARKAALPTYWCLHDDKTQQMNTLAWARAGMSGWPHFRGLPESMYESSSIKEYASGYNYNNGAKRWREPRWADVRQGGERWNRTIDELVALDFTLGPTFSVYEVFRDYNAASHAEWNADYLHPALLRDFAPGTALYNSEFVGWSTADEIRWKKDFQAWMAFVNDYKNRGGRVIAGSDAGYFWTIAGFALIRNMELLQEAGFTPLEVIRAATLDSAEFLRIDKTTGSVEIGKRADLLIVDQNPLENLKVLYGTGALGIDANGKLTRVGGVRYTIKSGLLYDSRAVLANVKEMVRDARARAAASP